MPNAAHEKLTYPTNKKTDTNHQKISVWALGMSLGIFLAVTFSICVVFDLLFPNLAMYSVWMKLLPGFTWISWSSFFLGMAETFAYGWYVALIIGPLYNYLSSAK